MNIKQRALELLQEKSMRGRVPSEVQDLLREVAALEPAGYIWPDSVHALKAHEQRYEVLWAEPTGQAGLPVYTLTGDSHE